MANRILPPSQAELKRILNYDHATGLFTWRVRQARCVKIGSLAGSMTRKGYIRIKIGAFPYHAHRLAWLYANGEWPDFIDHIDQDKANNRIANLRPATASQNAWNSKRRTNNTSGFKGVSRNPSVKGRSWIATITVGYKRKTIGRFATRETAHAAYLAAADKYHGEFARAG